MAVKAEAAGHEVVVVWQGRTVRSWVPAPLARRDLSLTEATVRRTEQAAARSRRADDALPQEWEPLVRLLVRAEAASSSWIEGVAAPPAEVALGELVPPQAGAAAEVASNLTVVRRALDEAGTAALTPSMLHAWHEELMAPASHLPAGLVGVPRHVQGWIGGTSPLDAALVTPPPEHVPGLLDDLVAFANRADVDAVTQAAVAHAQFEVIHPYADGNGRVGRVLVAWLLTRRLSLAAAPPVSLGIAADRGGYLAGLTLFRLGQVDAWVRWFADVVADAGDLQVNLVQAVGELQARWAQQLAPVRVDAAAHRVLALLPQHPVLTAATVSAALQVSERSGRTALETLAQRGIVEAYEPPARRRGRPRRWWVAPEMLSLTASSSAHRHSQTRGCDGRR